MCRTTGTECCSPMWATEREEAMVSKKLGMKFFINLKKQQKYKCRDARWVGPGVQKTRHDFLGMLWPDCSVSYESLISQKKILFILGTLSIWPFISFWSSRSLRIFFYLWPFPALLLVNLLAFLIRLWKNHDVME